MSNNVAWHHKVPSADQLRLALDELDHAANPTTPGEAMTDTLSQSTSLADQPRYDCRDAYVKTLSELADADHRIVGVVNDSIGSSKLDAFKKAISRTG